MYQGLLMALVLKHSHALAPIMLVYPLRWGCSSSFHCRESSRNGWFQSPEARALKRESCRQTLLGVRRLPFLWMRRSMLRIGREAKRTLCSEDWTWIQTECRSISQECFERFSNRLLSFFDSPVLFSRFHSLIAPLFTSIFCHFGVLQWVRSSISRKCQYIIFLGQNGCFCKCPSLAWIQVTNQCRWRIIACHITLWNDSSLYLVFAILQD